jgi:hypothetical protein
MDWSAAGALSEIDAVFEPDDARHQQALAGYERFTDAYARLKEWFAREAS